MRPAIILAIVTIALAVYGFRPIAVAAQSSLPAETFTPEVPLPGVFAGTQDADDSLLSRYIQAIYIYFIWIVGILATVMVIYGGIRWVGAAGNPGQIKEARDIIDNAIIGVIIGLTSVVLLNIINPKLTRLNLPIPSQITKLYFDGSAVTKVCPVSSVASQNVVCGNIKKIGTTTDRNGLQVDEFCAGVVCEFDSTLGFGGHDKVCQLTKATDSGYYRPEGCLTEVPIEPRSGDYQNVTTLEVANDRGVGNGQNCGRAYSDIRVAGGHCDNLPGAHFNSRNACYFEGLQVKITDNSGTNDLIDNMHCASQ